MYSRPTARSCAFGSCGCAALADSSRLASWRKPTESAICRLGCYGLFPDISTSPIGLQYAAEISHPTPEGTFNGLIQLFGQASVVFVYIMEAMKTEDGSFTPALLLATGLLMVSAFLVSRMRNTGQ